MNAEEIARAVKIAALHSDSRLAMDEALALARALLICVEALEKIEEWRPRTFSYCQGCYCETEHMAGAALLKIRAQETP